jgi:hypothetical protein
MSHDNRHTDDLSPAIAVQGTLFEPGQLHIAEAVAASRPLMQALPHALEAHVNGDYGIASSNEVDGNLLSINAGSGLITSVHSASDLLGTGFRDTDWLELTTRLDPKRSTVTYVQHVNTDNQ